MAGNQEHIRHSKFRSFYSARTIFLDFSLFGRGQRAGDLLKGFVLRDATLSGHTGAAELHTGPGRGMCPTAPAGAMLGHLHSPITLSTKPGAPPCPSSPTPSSPSDRSPCQRGVRRRACRINTHPLYTSRCLSGTAAQSLFLNSLLYYTRQQIATACPPHIAGAALLHVPASTQHGDGAQGGQQAPTRSSPHHRWGVRPCPCPCKAETTRGFIPVCQRDISCALSPGFAGGKGAEGAASPNPPAAGAGTTKPTADLAGLSIPAPRCAVLGHVSLCPTSTASR